MWVLVISREIDIKIYFHMIAKPFVKLKVKFSIY